MADKRINVLYVHFGEHAIRGSEICLLNLLEKIDKKQFNPIVWCNSPILATHVKRLGIKVLRSKFTLLLGWQKPRFDLLNTVKLIKQGVSFIKEKSIDLVHCNSAGPCQWMSIACRLTSVKLLVHLHAPYPLRDRLTLGLHAADKVISVNNQIKQQLVKDGTPNSRLQVIANGIDIKKLEDHFSDNVRRTLGLHDDDILLATVNYLNHSKGVDNCIDLIAKLERNHHIKAHLIIIGDGPLREQLMDRAKNINVDQRIHFMGNSENVQSLLLDNPDFYVCGSREESFGLAIAEAAVAKLPIVAPNVGGIPMIIKHGYSGLLYKSQDIDDFAKQMSLLIANKSLQNQLIKTAYQHVSDNFSIEHHIAQFQLCYQLLHCQKHKAKWSFSVRPFKTIFSIAINQLKFYLSSKITIK